MPDTATSEEDHHRKRGMMSVAKLVLFRGIPPGSASCFSRAGEYDAVAVIFDAMGDKQGAENMRAMSDTWMKIGRDA